MTQMRHADVLGQALVLLAVGYIGVIAPALASAQGPAAGGASPMPAGVQAGKLPDGSMMLTDARGMTLYTFVKDTPRQSNCTGACAKQWPPLMAAEGAAAAGDWTIVTREDGSKQWAHRGMPLYGWIKDAKPGDLTGDGVGGAWKVAAAGAAPNMVRVHLAHVTATFPDTPSQQGLLATALAEARIAAQHAALAATSGDSLDAMKLHAGHVIHAVDPRIEPKGPGLNYGVKRAAAGVVEHVQLAAKVPTASNNVLTHASHVLASATTVVNRADEIVAVARRIRAATTAAEAAPDVTQLNLLAQQLTSGLDVNRDGQVGWQTGEGGLEQAQMHMQLMLKGEGT